MSTTRATRTKPTETQAGERDPIPEAMFLQIHGGGSATMRMVELPPGPVRVGRGPLCEVQLADTLLADVQCILRLKGTTWHYQPVGPSGRVWIDGRPAEDPRTVSQGVPFRVGDHWLTLRSAQNAFNDWVAFDDPVPVVPDNSMVDVELDSPEGQSGPVGGPRPGATTDENEERLRRWQARLEQRERMLKARQDERRWEARWKSAGESIRARSSSTARPTPRPEAKIATPRTPPPPSTPRPQQSPPVSRIIEARPPEPTRRVVEPPVRPETNRPSVRPIPEPPSVLRRPVETTTVRVPLRTTVRVVPASAPATSRVILPAPTSSQVALPGSINQVTLPSTLVDWSTSRSAPIEVETAAPAEPVAMPVLAEPVVIVTPSLAEPISIVVDEAPTSFFDDVEIESILETEAERVELVEEDSNPVETIEAAVEESDDVESVEHESPEEFASIEVPTLASETPVRIEASAWVDEVADDEELEEEPPIVQAISTPVATTQAPAEPVPSRWSDAPIVEDSFGNGPLKSDYPSAKVIFAAQGRRAHRALIPQPSTRRQAAEPIPTDSSAPAQWSVPFWLGGLPTVAATLFLGVVGLAFAYGWMVESGNSNLGLRLALRPPTAASSLIDPVMIPRGGWWSSTATHQAAWAVALERADDGEDHSEDIRSLLASAREGSPLAARARFNVEAPEAAPGAIDPDDFSEIGRTRDVVSLISTGRRLREAGKLDSSIRAYRTALEIGLTAGRDGLESPTFDDDSQVRRYALPHESLVGLVVRNMAQRGDWTLDQWTAALPQSAVAPLVAARILARAQKRTEADALADLAIKQLGKTPPPGYDPAEHHAAIAEALAYRGRWTDASEQYRLAIDQVEDDATRRSWWLNFAELAARMSDIPAQARAIEAAQSPDTVDEITQRARKYQENLPAIVSPGLRR